MFSCSLCLPVSTRVGKKNAPFGPSVQCFHAHLSFERIKKKGKEIAALVIVIAVMPSLLSRLYVLVVMIIRFSCSQEGLLSFVVVKRAC